MPALDAAAGQPHGEAVEVVVAADEFAARFAHRRAAELAAPDDERVVEQPALLEVGEQRGDGLVGLAAAASSVSPMSSPASPWWSQSRVIELHEADAALDQPAGEQAVVGERGLARLGAVQLERLVGLAATGPSAPGTLVCMRKAIS